MLYLVTLYIYIYTRVTFWDLKSNHHFWRISLTSLLLTVVRWKGFWTIDFSLEINLNLQVTLWKKLDLFLMGEVPDQYKLTLLNQ